MFSIFKVSRPSDPKRDFIEAALFYYFSEYGFKCARVERNGIDFLAKNLKTNELLGIDIRSTNASEQDIIIPLAELDEARAACIGFGSTPYFALTAVQEKQIWLFIVRVEHLVRISNRSGDSIKWSFGQTAIDRYLADPQIVSIEMNSKVWRWW